MVELKKLTENGGKMIKNVEFVDSCGYVEKAMAILRVTGNLRLVGETGAGKTTLVYKLAELTGLPLYEDVLNQDTTKWDLLGSDVLKGGETDVREGILTKWLRNFGIAYLDGFARGRSGLLSLLESLSDFRGTVWVPELETSFKRTEKHYLIISYNPFEKIGYSGTHLINIATIRRFEGIIVDYLPAIDERRLIKKYAGGNYDFASKFVQIARNTRALYRGGNLRAPLTTGNLINYAKLFHKEKLDEATIIEIASSLYPEDERGTFTRLFEESGEIDVESLKPNSEQT